MCSPMSIPLVVFNKLHIFIVQSYGLSSVLPPKLFPRPRMASTPDERHIRDLTAAFLEYDGGSKGHLTRHELKAAHLALLGYVPSLLELDALLPKRPGCDIGMALPEFCTVMAQRVRTQDCDDVIRRTFRAFDTQLKGYVSFADMQSALQEVAPGLPPHTASLAFSQIDADGDGRVSYKDFYSMMTSRVA